MGADPELGSKLDRTPLSKACFLGNVKVVEFLLSINVSMIKQDNKGRTPLHNAVWGAAGGRDGKRRGHIIL
jgi:ankyrin repeat protein